MMIDVQSLSFPDLLKLRKQLDAQIAVRKEQEQAEAKKRIRELLKVHGLTLADFGEERPRRTMEAKYQDPASGKTWSGQGRKPSWVERALVEGKVLDDLRIRK
ncbi:H-NS family nucleoid-associated regulatory protein [Chromobacterium piscinae]|uniref:H-NS histone family protein n=1 Tax=Chromobacterium piscinae TaxID=686831 RepID=UPI001E3CECFC|nr:H-NS histone family protein [Chromobacterium piscinae]MCD5327908.1 H-NS histone family protein [Chromobacterium piscinae]